MDPFSTAVGVISLGIQLSNSLMEYIDGLRCAKLELAATMRQMDSLQLTLDVLTSGLRKIGPVNEAPETNIGRCIASLETDMSSLIDYLTKLKHEEPGDRLRRRWKEQKKRLSYPFNRPALLKLENRLSRTNVVLLMMVQGMDLCVEFQPSLRDSSKTDITPGMSRLSISKPSAEPTSSYLASRHS